MDAHWQLGTHTTEPRTGFDLGHPLWVLPALAIRRAAFDWLHRACGMAASDNCCNLAQLSIIGRGLTVRSTRTRFVVSFKCVAICYIAGSQLSWQRRSEEHTSELQSLMRNSYAGFCLNKKTHNANIHAIQSNPSA